MRIVRGFSLALGVVAVGVLGIPTMTSVASSAPAPYHITVAPLSQLPGHTVKVTGTTPTNGGHCDSETVYVTVTYFTATGAQKSKKTTFGQANGTGDFSVTVTIPADAAPTSVSHHNAVIVGGCTDQTVVYTSNPVTVVVEGTVPPTTTTTTTTTAPTTTTTTTTAPTTTTTVPATVAPAATAVSASPTFTG